MTCKALFDSAVALLCEDPGDSDRIADYTERAPYLFALCASECHSLDNQYRTAHGLEPTVALASATIPLESPLPLSEIFASAAVYYVAAMLISDENEGLSDKFFALYTDAVSTIQTSIPSAFHKITDVYGLH
jgi:hypothetical protein